MRDQRWHHRTIHVSHVSVDLVERHTRVTDYSWQHHGHDIVVRNDGPSAVTIRGIAQAYGQKFVINNLYPVHWEIDIVPPGKMPRRLLPPGEEVVVEGSDSRTGINILGPLVTITDTNGRVWQRTTWGWRELDRPDSLPPPRRYLWFEKWSWFPKVDAKLFERGARKARKHPRRLPWEIRFIDFAWGYRAGRNDGALLPWDAPRSWYYTGLLPPANSRSSEGN